MNKTVIDYMIIEGNSVLEILREVAELLPEWQPEGGAQLAVDEGNEHYQYIQTMVKYEVAEPAASKEPEAINSLDNAGWPRDEILIGRLGQHQAAYIYMSLRILGGRCSRGQLQGILGIDRKTLSKGLAVLTELDLIATSGDRNPTITLVE